MSNLKSSSSSLSLLNIFRASNFTEYMWPSFALSQSFGLFPYKISRDTISASIFGYVYATSVITGLTIAILTIVYHINFSDGMQYETFPALLQANSYMLLGYIYCFSSFIRSEKKLILFKKLIEISFHVPKSKWNKYSLYIHFKDIIGFLFLLGQAPNTLKGNFLDIFAKLIGFYVTFVIYLLDNQFLNCILATKLSFENMNKELNLFENKLTSLQEFHSISYRFNRDKIQILNSIIEIRSLRKKYEDICSVVKSTNDTFSMPILISLAFTFAEVTFSIYFYILKSIGSKEINLEKQFWYFYFITSATYYSTKFLSLIWSCEITGNEMQKSKIIIHRILTKLYDKEISQELQSFSLQMVQRNVSFAAHGISLDGSLVTRIAGGISTYILILIQFLIASKHCENIG